MVLLSGGQDSATCLALASRDYKNVYTISFNYGQRHIRELECSELLSKLSGAKGHFEIPITSIPYLGNTTLIGNGDVSANHKTNQDLPATFVPGRNYIFLGLAAAKAFQLGINDLSTGVCETDFSNYPDCRDNSIKAVQKAICLCLDYDINIHTPLMWKTKAETVLMMKELGKLDWYKNTHTCYEGLNPPCMKCPACELRLKGFKEANIEDPIIDG